MKSNRSIHIASLRLQNARQVIHVSVDFVDRRGIYLTLMVTTGGMYQMFGGPRGAKVCLEESSRFNEKKLVQWAETVKAGCQEYTKALEAVCTANGFVLAASEDDAYRPPEFVRGQRVTIGKEPALIVNVNEEADRFSGQKTYDLVLDSNWFWTDREADSLHGDIRAIEGEPILDGHAVDMRFREYQEAASEREGAKEAVQRGEDIEVEKFTRELRAKYPWVESADPSKNLKTELGLAFPGVAFSVRRESHSSVYVSWTDGPTSDQVTAIAEKYQYFSHTEIDDSSVNKTGPERKAIAAYLGDVRFVSVSRQLSDRAIDAVREALAPYPHGGDIHYHPTYGVFTVLHRSEIYGEFERLDMGSEVKAIFKPVTPAAVALPVPVAHNGGDITVRENPSKGGVEVQFASKPSADILTRLKANGFRWSKFQKLWYAKATERTRGFANSLAGGSSPVAEKPDLFDMQVEDNMAAACGL